MPEPPGHLPAYTVAAVTAPLLVLALELLVLRTGLLRSPQYWLTLVIVLGFQVPVDGWLTKPQAAVVHYQDSAVIGVRVLWFPVEDFGFGFALVTLTLLCWRWGRAAASYRGSGLEGRGAAASAHTTNTASAITTSDQSG